MSGYLAKLLRGHRELAGFATCPLQISQLAPVREMPWTKDTLKMIIVSTAK
jgi:hypothetical protein